MSRIVVRLVSGGWLGPISTNDAGLGSWHVRHNGVLYGVVFQQGKASDVSGLAATERRALLREVKKRGAKGRVVRLVSRAEAVERAERLGRSIALYQAAAMLAALPNAKDCHIQETREALLEMAAMAEREGASRG